MDGIQLITAGVIMFTTIVFILLSVILFARSLLVPKGKAVITINDDPDHTFEIQTGDKLGKSKSISTLGLRRRRIVRTMQNHYFQRRRRCSAH